MLNVQQLAMQHNGNGNSHPPLFLPAGPVQAPPEPKPERLDLPPHSIETEENLLGAVLMNPETLVYCQSVVQPEDFYIVRHGWVWRAFLDLHADPQGVIDNRTVAERLRVQPDPTGKHASKLDALGGEAYLNYLPSNVPSALHAEIYAHIVKRAAVRRRLLGIAGEISQLAYDENNALPDILNKTQQLVMDVKIDEADTEKPLSRSLADLMTFLETFRDKQHAPGILTPFPKLNTILSGFQPGKLYIVAGLTGIGKTSLLLEFLLTALEAGKKGLMFSQEMDDWELILRVLAQKVGFSTDYTSLQQLHVPGVGDGMWESLVREIGELSTLKHWTKDSASMTPIQALDAARRRKWEDGLDFIIVDYLQLWHYPGARGRTEEVGQIAYALKEMARSLNVPVIAAAQLSRELFKRQNKRPMLSDLRESGDIEHAADVVLFLHREGYFAEQEKSPEEMALLTDREKAALDMAEVICAKHRGGPKGNVSVEWDAPLTRFLPI